MGSRPTIEDVARAAGVSVATVDRVLNGRQKVREDTARRVYEAAIEVGYHAASLIRQRVDATLPEIRLGFILQQQDHAFYDVFGRKLLAAAEHATRARVRAKLVYVPKQTPEDVVAALQAIESQVDAIALTSLDHHTVTRAASQMKDKGKPVFALLSDFAQGIREAYIGTNNLRVGRTAAWFIARTARRPGKVALFVGSHRWHGHQLRETGFRSYFREQSEPFHVLETLVNLDTRRVTYEATLALMERHPDVAGVYLAGGGMEGAIRALREVVPVEPPTVLVNELTPDSMAALQDGIVTAVLATPLDRLCSTLIDMMTRAVLEGPSEAPGQIFLPVEILVSENV
jgi:LacI family transcriptional regulator